LGDVEGFVNYEIKVTRSNEARKRKKENPKKGGAFCG